MMIRLLAFTAAAALLAGCAGMDPTGTETAREAATRQGSAAFLGYHGPVERMTARSAN